MPDGGRKNEEDELLRGPRLILVPRLQVALLAVMIDEIAHASATDSPFLLSTTRKTTVSACYIIEKKMLHFF